MENRASFHKLRPLDADELAELAAFAAKAGRGWKQRLSNDYWFRGLAVPGFPLLYGLRNSHGPTWLDRFSFPKEPAQ